MLWHSVTLHTNKQTCPAVCESQPLHKRYGCSCLLVLLPCLLRVSLSFSFSILSLSTAPSFVSYDPIYFLPEIHKYYSQIKPAQRTYTCVHTNTNNTFIYHVKAHLLSLIFTLMIVLALLLCLVNVSLETPGMICWKMSWYISFCFNHSCQSLMQTYDGQKSKFIFTNML